MNVVQLLAAAATAPLRVISVCSSCRGWWWWSLPWSSLSFSGRRRRRGSSISCSGCRSLNLVVAIILVVASDYNASAAICDQVHELTTQGGGGGSNGNGLGSGYSDQQQPSTTNVITIDSPNYPYTQYPPLSSCRHLIKAPAGYAITVQCNLNLPVRGGGTSAPTSSAGVATNSADCQTDFLYISAPATDDTNDGNFEYFCGRGYVSRTSVFSSLTLAYASTSRAVAGYFSCTAFATRQNCDCGWNPRTRRPGSGRIIGGQEAIVNEYTGMVALVDKLTARVFCGGSIIHQRYVLTAAHCLDGDHANGNEFYILVGDHDITTGSDTKYSQLYYVEEVRDHERYNPTGFANDIALLRTTEDIVFSRAVGPICLPFRFFGNTFENQIVEIAGWGTTEFGGGASGNQPARLRKTTLTMLSNSVCKSMDYLNAAQITDDILCTYSNDGRDSCQMDSGGNLMWRSVAGGGGTISPADGRLYTVGIISYGRQCGRNTPGFNTRVTNYLNWIIANSRGANFCIP